MTTSLPAHFSAGFSTPLWRLLLLCILGLYSWQGTSQDLTLVMPPDVAICSGESVVLNPTVNGGSGDYTFSWTPATDLSCSDCLFPTASPSTSVMYTLTVNDGVEQVMGSVEVAVIEINVTINVFNATCLGDLNNGSIDIEVAGGVLPYTYTWSNGANTEDLTNLTAGVYTVTITDDVGCTLTQIAVVSEVPPPVVEVAATSSTCGQNDGVITIMASGGAPPYEFSINNGTVWQTTSDFTNLPAGEYCIWVRDINFCMVDAGCVTLEGQGGFTAEFSFDGNPFCENVAGTATAAPIGGIAPFVYVWTQLDGTPIGGAPNVPVLPGSSIRLELTDFLGCTFTDIYNVPQPTATPTLAERQFLDCGSGVNLLDGTVESASPDISYTWYQDGNIIANTPITSVTETGIYTLDIEHISGCINQRTVEVLSFAEDYDINIISTNLGCNEYRLSIDWPDPVPNADFAWLWRLPSGATASGLPAIDPAETGVYQLEITEANSLCTRTVAQFVDLEVESCATIQGRVVFDEFEDCIASSIETGLNQWLIQAESGTDIYYSLTDSDGSYQFSLPLNTYTLTALPPSTAWSLCDDSYTLSLSTEGEVQEQNIPAQRVVNCPQLSVDINANLLRRCFSGNYTVQVCNLGTEAAFAPVVQLELDPFLTFTGASTSFEEDGQQITLNMLPLAAGECASFFVYVDVSCEAALGQTHCTFASVTPDALCLPTNPAWSGANLQVEGVCNGNEVSFVIRNEGSGALDEPVQYIVIEDGVMLMQSAAEIQALASLSDTTINLPANGSTYTIIVDQAEFHPYTTSLVTFVEGCTSEAGGSFSTGFANQFGANTNSISSDKDCTENIGSYDPNDKLAFPAGYGDEHYIFPNQAIDYRIRFQNTGTDTAFTVVIRDELSEHLDISSLQLGAASHTYRASFQDERTLVFTFDNIMLPDSNVNLEGSNGFVNYRIAPRSDIPLETKIENGAAIYFDFNDPVLTPVIFHTVSDNFLDVVATTAPQVPGLQVEVFPNPTTSQIQLQLNGSPLGTRQLIWYDALGRKVGAEQFEGNTYATRLPTARAGWYYFRLRVENEWVASGKVALVSK